jgi:hypothetical protein
MTQITLQDFINTVVASNRITFGDVRRLNRSILPDGPMEREEVEALLRLDATIARSDASWGDWLVQAVVDFAVWGERPTGTVEGEAARWLIEALSSHGPMTKAAKRIAREIEREAELADASIAALADEAEASGEAEIAAVAQLEAPTIDEAQPRAAA